MANLMVVIQLLVDAFKTAGLGNDAKDMIIAGIVCINTFIGGSSANTVADMMTFTDNDAAMINLLLEWSRPIAMSLLAIFFSAGLLEQASRTGKDLEIQDFLKQGLILIIADIFLMACPYIISQFADLSNGAAETAKSIISDGSATAIVDEIDSYKDYNILSLMLRFLISLMSLIIGLVPLVVLTIVSFSAKLEVLIRFGMLPIGISGFASDNGRQGAIKYVKKMLASSLYAGAIIMVIYVANKLEFNSPVGSFDELATEGGLFVAGVKSIAECFLKLVIPIVAIGGVSTAKSVINEACGV